MDPDRKTPGDREVEHIRHTIQQFRRAQIYITFAELEIGAALEGGSMRLADLARALNVDESALQRFMDAAEAFSLIHTGEELGYELTPLGYDLYAPSSEHSLSNSFKLEGAFYQRWGRLAEAITSGDRPEANQAQEDDPGWVRMFTLALYENSRGAAASVANSISTLLPVSSEGRLSVLDLGGGHGGYSIALARVRAGIHATVFDLPSVIDVTREIIAQSGLSDRVKAVAGDFHVDPIGEDYDIILLFGVLHGETPDGVRDLLRTIHRALGPEGRLLIRARGGPSGTPEQGEREIFDLHMLLSTASGRVRRATDTQSLVEGAGFRFEEAIDIAAPGSGRVLVFRPR
jgi:SAM-dependent methyltransferase